MGTIISYTDQDYSQILEGLVANIPNLTDRWTDYNDDDIGMVTLQLQAGIGEALMFKQDIQANEAFLQTARERKNVMKHCGTIGYKLAARTSATADVKVTLTNGPHTRAVTIPKWHRFATISANQIEFVATASTTIPAGIPYVTVGVRQGLLVDDNFVSSGAGNQIFTLSSQEIAQGTVEVYVDDVQWRERPDFSASTGGDRHFVVEVNEYEWTRIRFGDGIFGAIPRRNASIRVLSLSSRGADGTVGNNKIVKSPESIYDSNGDAVPVTVTNPNASTSGTNKETIEHAKVLSRPAAAALERLVSTRDHEYLIPANVPGIGKIRAWGEEDENPPNHDMANKYRIAVAPVGGGIPSSVLKQDILDFIEGTGRFDQVRKEMCTRYEILDPDYVAVDVTADVFLPYGVDQARTHADILVALADLFAFDNLDFHETVYPSNITRVIENVQGVHHIILTVPAVPPIFTANNQILVLGTVTLNFTRVE